MKNFLLLTLFSFFLLIAKSQVVTGVYKGKMVSDSLSYAVDFELTLKEKNGQLYGYCQRLFLINDVLYYNLVKVKARIKDDILIVEDEKSVSNNFEEKRTGIKTVYMFNIKDIVDTASVLNGDWTTSGSRKLYAMPGKLIVNRERNYLTTQLYKRLEEKKLAKEMLFEEKTKPQTVLVYAPVTKPETKKEQPLKTEVVVTQPNKQTNPPVTIPSTKDSVQQTANIPGNQQQTKQKTEITLNQPKQQTNQPTNTSKPITNKPSTVPTKEPVKNTTAVTTGQPKQQSTTSTTNPQTKPVPAVTTTPVTKQNTETGISSVGKIATENKIDQAVVSSKPPIINNPVIIKRTTEIIDALEVTGDSVLLTLYDNGEIDGDTVSVFLNNELMIAKVGLRAQAFKHTIAIKPGEVVQLTLFAENLGSIPPNTGLLVITTEDQRYQIHFSSTLNKSSSIVIRRKE